MTDKTSAALSSATRPRCSCCGGEMQPFYEQKGVPVNSCILVSDQAEARAFPRGNILLAFCDSCGFVRNVAFEAEKTEYSGRYEETQGYSATFNAFHRKLAGDLIDRHGIREKHVVEIGCGKGEFLELICRMGGNSGVGYDPSYDTERGIIGEGVNARVVRDFYGPQYGDADADVLVCKMTLEHIEQCFDFVDAARLALRSEPGTFAFFQVPESMRIFRNCAFEDVYYEHCSYFTPGSAARLFRAAGYGVQALDVTYGGQYLTILATKDDGSTQSTLANEEPVEELAAHASTFAERCEAAIRHWRETVEKRSAEGPVVIWGSGSKGVAFLHALEHDDAVHAAVDINPNRQSCYMLGTGQPILAPQSLVELQPRTVIAMNRMYAAEIASNLHALGVEAELLAL